MRLGFGRVLELHGVEGPDDGGPAVAPGNKTDDQEEEGGCGLDGRLQEGEEGRLAGLLLKRGLGDAERYRGYVKEVDEGLAADERPDPRRVDHVRLQGDMRRNIDCLLNRTTQRIWIFITANLNNKSQ